MTDSTIKPVAAGERLAKVIARAGLCSRREAESWIAAGRVGVNGAIVRTPAFNVTGTDKVEVDGNPLEPKRSTRLWLYHKPQGLVVTENDPEGRKTVFEDLAQKDLPRVLSIGRLDINTEGLLLLTNDGGLKRVLELPETGWLRKYRVRAFGSVTQEKLDTLQKGLTVEGIAYGPITATLERVQGNNVWLLVALREGKNREIKNVLGALGLQVNRLIRVSFGPFQLGDLPIGGVSLVRQKMLRDQLGKRLAEEAGVDFDAPLPEAETDPQRPPALQPRKTADPDRRPGPRRTDRPASDQSDRHGRQDRSSGHDRFGRSDRSDRNDRSARQGRPGSQDRSDRRGRFDRQDGERQDRQDRHGERTQRFPRAPKVFFDDGRPPEDYESRARKPDDRKAGPSGDRGPGRGFAGQKPGPRADGAKGSGPKGAGSRDMGARDDGPRRDRPRSDRPGQDGPKRSGPRPGPRRDGPRPGPRKGGR